MARKYTVLGFEFTQIIFLEENKKQGKRFFVFCSKIFEVGVKKVSRTVVDSFIPYNVFMNLFSIGYVV